MRIVPSTPEGLPVDPNDLIYPRFFNGEDLMVFDNSLELENYINETYPINPIGPYIPLNVGSDGALSGRWIYGGDISSSKDTFFYTDSQDLSLVTRIVLNRFNYETVDYKNLLLDLQNSISQGKSTFIQVVKLSDNSIIGIYKISSSFYDIGDDAGTDIILSSVLVSNGTLTENEVYSISFQTSGQSGMTGSIGPTGPSGSQGSVGPQGYQGPTGPQGLWGPQGIDGSTGPQGTQGPQGSQGSQGQTGPQGIQGSQGDVGPQGFRGPTGSDGSVGPQGSTGVQGPTGPQGSQGNQGSVGPQGSTGPQGTNGSQGSTGPQGATGLGTNIKVFGIVLDGGGADITTGIKGDILIPYNMTITSWTLLGDQSGSLVIDLWKDTYTNFPPTSLVTITGAEKPTLTAQNKNQDLSISTWTVNINSGDIIRFNVDSCSGIQRATLTVAGTIY